MKTQRIITLILALSILAWCPIQKKIQKVQDQSWNNGYDVQYVDVNGVNTRYLKTGQGEPICCLHTIRT